MASKSAYQSTEKGAEIEEALDLFEKLLERLRGMYEQYFLGLSKVAPSQLHTEAERRQRDLTQIQIKNTALRYRYATLSQKFGAYNTYWKRTMRMIEQGRYVRDLQRVQRQAQKTGEDIPEEILAAMPKLMRERVKRDRAAQERIAVRQGKLGVGTGQQPIGPPDGPDDDELVTPPARPAPGHVHRLDDALVPDDVDLDEMFATLTRDAEAALDAEPAIVRAPPPRRDPVPVPPARSVEPPSAPPPPIGRSRGPTTPPLRPPPMRATGPMRSGPPPTPAPRPVTAAAPPPPPSPTAAPASARPAPPASSAAPRPAAARPGVSDGRPAMGPPPGMSETETRTLYNRYLKARELCGESNEGVTYDKLVRTLRSQSSRIMTDHQARGVEFGVVIKDNKVVLKAKPKI